MEHMTAAIEQERLRVAADIHDLIMQDLSLALANARMLAGADCADTTNATRARLVVSAGERALAGARTIVSGLTEPPTSDAQPLAHTIESSARAAAHGAQLSFDAGEVPHWAYADRRTREVLVHVAREAVRNASKHAGVDAIEVSLRYDGGWRLTVSDAGTGFDGNGDGERTDSGFGLRSMRAQVQALGGRLHVHSAAQQGTTVEAMLP
jgi:two-component system NarL family sensor kinase